MPEKKILIVDDKKNIRMVLNDLLVTEGYDTLTAESGEKGLELFEKERVDLILTDLIMKGISGVDFIQKIREKDTSVPIIILTAFGSISSAVEAIKSGADDYLTKPLNYDLLKMRISKLFEDRKRDHELSTLKATLKGKWGIDDIIGRSPVMERMFDLISAVAPTDSPVLIQGECGTGKELIAKSIHSKSQRSKEPFVIVDCSAIPESLIESVLFGYEKGSFTGADVQRIGRIEESQGGTLFLDEVGELPLSSQAKFLRVIQEHQFVRVGGSAQVKVDFRVLAATNKNLKEEVEAGRFRSDLFYRLNVIRIDSPPLRDRKDDIPLLSEFFMQQICRENSLPYREISKEELSKMMAYPWPGNVRELRNCIQRLCILDSLSQEIEAYGSQEHLPSQSPKLSDQEKALVQQALELTNWNISRAAQHLGIGRKALYNRIAKYQIPVPNRTL